MIIGTAGHIDHGKTTLVKALTGVDCDRLPEEKARGITLDLGYAYTPLPDGSVLGFIDVPGHEKLIHNMLAGATGIDYVLLVVAADDGVMPQTREHLELIALLGITRGAVAITKCDAVEAARIEAVEAEVRKLLQPTPLATAPLFRVTAISGAGIAALRRHLECEASQTKARERAGAFRLAIDRAFTLPGVGTVVTGTAHAGEIGVGGMAVVLPTGLPARVKSLRVQDREAESGSAGQRIALALAGVSKQEIRRGMWLAAPELAGAVVSVFHGEVHVPPTAKPLQHLAVVHVHLGAADLTGRVALLDRAPEVAPGERALIEVLLDQPAHAVLGDRFILRDATAQHTVAGGRVLEIFPPRRYKRGAAHLAWLRDLSAGELDAALAHRAAASPVGIALARCALAWNRPRAEILRAAQAAGLLVIGTEDEACAFSPDHWSQLTTNLLETVRREHERAPDMVGITRERLKRMVAPQLSPESFAFLLTMLREAGKLDQTQSFLHLPEHRPQVLPTDRDLFAVVKPLLDASPFNPPRVRDVFRATGIAEERVRQLFRRIARAGELFAVAHDHYFTAQAVARLSEIVADLCAEKGAARAAEFRDRIFADGRGGRKVAIQILEFFDRIGYTRRVRDEHRLRTPFPRKT